MSIENINLSDTLFSKVRQRILGQLFVQPDRDYHTNELIRLTRMGSGAVQRELEKLSRVGLITVQVIGNQKRYKANKNSLLYEEIRNIVLKTFGLAAVMRQALEPIQNKLTKITKQPKIYLIGNENELKGLG